MSVIPSPTPSNPFPHEVVNQPGLRFHHRDSGRMVDSIWGELRVNGLWRQIDFEAHESNTLIGAGDRSDWLPMFADWFQVEEGQSWCPLKNRAVDPVYIATVTRDASMKDLLEAARIFFGRFEGRKIGVQLSGGFDSSLIIGLLRHFKIPHGLVGLKSDRYEFRTERFIQNQLANQNGEVILIDETTCLPCSRLGAVPPHQVPDLLSLDHAQGLEMAMACQELGIDVLLSGGGGDNLLGQAVPLEPASCQWRPQTFTDAFPTDIVYRPRGIQFLSFFGDIGIVNAFYSLRRGQQEDGRKRWARTFFRDFVPHELADYDYCADFWGRSIDGLALALDEIRCLHRDALLCTGNRYFAPERLEDLIRQDIYRPKKELYQRIEARTSAAVWVSSFARWAGLPMGAHGVPVPENPAALPTPKLQPE
jgi:hypothetical protein